MNRYRIRYYWCSDAKALKERAAETFGMFQKDIEAPTPISAINQFHKFMQYVKELAADQRTILRPMLMPDQYKVFSLHQFYYDCGFRTDISNCPLVESHVDYPRSPNPDLHHDNSGRLEEGNSQVKKYEEFDFGPNNPTD